MSILSILKLAGAAPAPGASSAPAPAAPMPNAVSAPTVNVMGAGGGGGFMPGRRAATRVAPSAPTGNGANHAATPLMPAAPSMPGQMVSQGGMLLSPEDAQQQQEAEMMAQQEAQKNAPKAPAAPKQDTPLSTQLLERWSDRLGKIASDPGFAAVKQFPGGSSQFDWRERGGIAGGVPQIDTYNPFTAGTFGNTAYGLAKNILTSKLRNVKSKNWIEDDFRGPATPYTQALARNMAEPVGVGSSTNPLLALGGNLVSSWLGGGAAPDAAALQDAYVKTQQTF